MSKAEPELCAHCGVVLEGETWPDPAGKICLDCRDNLNRRSFNMCLTGTPFESDSGMAGEKTDLEVPK